MPKVNDWRLIQHNGLVAFQVFRGGEIEMRIFGISGNQIGEPEVIEVPPPKQGGKLGDGWYEHGLPLVFANAMMRDAGMEPCISLWMPDYISMPNAPRRRGGDPKLVRDIPSDSVSLAVADITYSELDTILDELKKRDKEVQAPLDRLKAYNADLREKSWYNFKKADDEPQD